MATDAKDHREASVITFMATASGMSLLGLGSAFWGMMIGVVAYLILHRTNRVKTPRTASATGGKEKG
ncbi:benzoate/H(+) symporter BenE family transporter [Halomonas huangheensis]|uniref:benzoate/H(+) symporter BenE family transporter n=1 Tax=Halomonas huangheensis TaxID=1178482 RepID=UPI000A7AFBED|nr:benzoate/H(+) symporter BenE family transporter [Halomonas huangheensis]